VCCDELVGCVNAVPASFINDFFLTRDLGKKPNLQTSTSTKNPAPNVDGNQPVRSFSAEALGPAFGPSFVLHLKWITKHRPRLMDIFRPFSLSGPFDGACMRGAKFRICPVLKRPPILGHPQGSIECDRHPIPARPLEAIPKVMP
jgi:hypothetical protein